MHLERIWSYSTKWCQKCSLQQIIELTTSKVRLAELKTIEPLTEKTWGRGCVIFGEPKNKEHIFFFKHGAILYNEAEVFSLSITNPIGQPMLPFDSLIHSSLILASCHSILFLCWFSAVWEKIWKLKFVKNKQTDCEGNIFYLRWYGCSSASYLKEIP